MKNPAKTAFVILALIVATTFIFLGIGRREEWPEANLDTARSTRPRKADFISSRPVSEPTWAIAYEREFWRKPTSPQTIASNIPALNVREVVDRVSHAFRAADGATPTVNARDYTASLEGGSLLFRPASPSDDSKLDFKVTTTSAKIGDREIFSLTDSTSPGAIHYAGNTAQTILQAGAGLIQHLEARAEGVELTWILQHRPETKGTLRIEAAMDGFVCAGETNHGFHFADATGTSRVRVSNATLVDASGNRARVPTQVIDSRLVVQVPADLLATAAYPIAIDPLISAEFGMDRPVSAIAPGENAKVASNGADYLVVWHDWRNNRDVDIYGARISRDGWILDPNGIGIRVGHAGQDKFAVASNGADYLIVWTEYGNAIMGARLNSEGKLLDSNAILVCQSPLFPSRLSAAGNGDNYLVLWRDNREHRYDLYGGVIRASDGHVSNTSGTKLVEGSYADSAAAVAPHLGGFVAVWRGSGKTEGAMYRIQDGAIAPITGLQLPTASGPITSPAVASGPGGVLVVWEDFTDPGATKTDIYGQFLTPTGQPLNGKFPICNAAYNQNAPVVSANQEGFIVAWQDNRRGEGRETTNDVYFARVANNASVTPVNGRLLTAEPANGADRQNQTDPDIASNGDQGLIIWTDITPDLQQSVRSARITPDATNLDPHGLPVTVATINSQQDPEVAANSEGFLVAWIDQRNGADIYGARFTRDGRILDRDGIAISTARAGQNYLSLTSNGRDYFAIWSDSRNYAQDFGFDLYGARISGAGTVIDPDGIPINSGPGYDFYPKAASDGTNYVAVWQRIESKNHVYARLIRSAGDPLSGAAAQIKGPGGHQLFPNVASNGREYIVAWTDGDEFYADAYGQRLDHSGALIGAAFPISTKPKRQVAPLIASNGDGYFVTWLDGNYDSSNFDPQTMLGTRLGATGQVLDDPPILVQPNASSYLQRALASDGRDYLVLWQLFNGSIHGVRISADGQHTDGGSFTIASSAAALDKPALAASGGTYFVAYASSDTTGDFWRVRGRTVQFTLPEPWRESHIGDAPAPGGAGYKDGVFSIQGLTPHFIYQTLDGDGQIIARLKTISQLQPDGRVGIMLRDTLDPSSAHAFIGYNGNAQTIFTRRRTFGDTRVHTSEDGGPLPVWLKLIRAGELILAYRSEDAITWQRFDTTTINFGQKILVGLTINSGAATVATAQFDQVSIWRFQAPLDPPTAPTIAIQPRACGTIALQLTADAGALLQIETSTNLVDWTLLQNVTNSGSAMEINDPQPSSDALRFYRISPNE